MKKMSSTKHAILFHCFCFLFCLFQIPTQAQITLDLGKLTKRTVSCSSSTTFTDDNSTDGLYFDETARKDTLVLCPSAAGRQIKVSFTVFDVASGDQLIVYDGDLTKNPGAPSQSATGTGVSKAFGGWVAANCDPSVNPTGCLTFVFETNGDNVKGNGWQASITCESSSTTVQCPNNISIRDECNNLDGMVTVTIPRPTFTTCGGSSNAMVTITSNCSAITGGTVLADGSTLGTFTIPLGTYSITATSVADNSKSCTYFVFADQPNISCNDNLTSSIGFGCKASVRVDDIIENPCVGPGTTYKLSVDLGSKIGTKSVTVDGSSFSTLNNTTLELETDEFDCGSSYSIEVTRIVSFSGCGGGNSISNSCSGRVKFVDNSAPSIAVGDVTLVTCGDLTEEALKKQLSITVIDNCDVKDTTFSVGAFPSNFCSNNLSVPVTITAVDFCSNSNTETFNIKIVRPTNFYRPLDTVLTCGSGYGPEIAGYPLLDTDGDGKGDLPIIDNTCNFIPIYTDREVSAGNSSTIKIFRTWQIKDWCNQAVPVTLDPQLIELKDTGKPSIDCPSGSEKGTKGNPYTLVASGTDCSGSINFPAPSGNDDCGGNVTVSLDVAVDIWDKTKYTNTAGLPIGNYYAIYFGRDDAGNRSDTCKIYFDVKDNIAPNAICVDALNVSFVNGEARIKVEDIDAGSEDSCGPVTKEIRKEGGNWGQTVSLTCEEINNDGKVYLRVTDSNGGQNTCWVQITGKDSTVPECGELADQTLICEEVHVEDFGVSTDANDNKDFDENEWNSLTGNLLNTYNQTFGNPDCSDDSSCGGGAIEQEYQLVNASCGGTKIKRRFRATDGSANQSNWKEQLITLTVEEDFSLTFPADWQGACGDNFPEADLALATGGCSILAWAHADKRFEGVNDACYYIERTYSVTNWCYHQAGGPATIINRVEDEHGFSNGQTVSDATLANIGLFEYVQILKVVDSDAPVIVVNEVDDCVTNEDCTANKTFSISATDCLGESGLSYGYEFSTDGILLESGTGTSFSATVSLKTYQVKWIVNDNCGNTASAVETYTFRDCKAPSPFCLDGLAVAVGENGEATVWAKDINQKSFDNCSAEANLAIRIYHPILVNAGIDKPLSDADAATILALPENVTLDCDYLGNQEVDLYVIDEAGNWAYCTGSVFVQDGSGDCTGNLVDTSNVAMVAGGILAGNNIPLAGVTVTAKGTAFYEQTTITNESGIFELSLPKNIGYVINFSKPEDPGLGLSTFDIILVSKHILGITPFDAFWKQLAADMNKSGSVTAFDLVKMRQIILGLEDESIRENPWRFLPAEGEYLEKEDGMKLGEGILIPELTRDINTLDYLAIKLGDVNGSVEIDGFQKTEERTANALTINLLNRHYQLGEAIELPIEIANIADWQGLQFGLNFDGVSLEKVENGVGTTQHIAQTSPKEILIAWDKYSSDNLVQSTLFTFHLVANHSSKLSELITLSKDFHTEAIDNQDGIGNIQLNFVEESVNNSFNLHQNSPNPFSTATRITFDLPQAGFTKLEVFNSQGKLLKQFSGTYDKGQQEIIIEKANLPETGVLLYQLTTSMGTSSKKMIVMD